MNSGKSTHLINAAYSYMEKGLTPFIIKPIVDTRSFSVSNRVGTSMRVDLQLDSKHKLFEDYDLLFPEKVDVILVDEVQFLTISQIEDLLKIVVTHNIPVLCYGLRTDFTGTGFPASSRLLEIADSLSEIKNICDCGKKSTFSARIIDGEYLKTGEQVLIDDGETSVKYNSLCAKCYNNNVQLFNH